MAQTMSMGQAAGLAAVQSLRNDEAANRLTVSQLQQDLYELGAILDIPDTVADTSRHGWKANFP